MIAQLLDHVASPPGWNEYLCHVGSSFTAKPILQAGLIAGGRDPEEGRLTVFFTFVDPTAEETIISQIQENYTTRTGGQIYQVAIHWVNLEKAPDKGFTSLADPISRYHPS